MIVEMAIGDAYGAAFEFMRLPRPDLIHDTATYQKHPELEIGNGRYTDDTQMTLAIAEELLENGPDFTVLSLAERFVKTFKRDPRPGYGKAFYSALQEATDGPSLLGLIANPASTRSGAPMRVSPIGLLGDINDVLRLAALQASVTHNSPEAIMSAQAVAAMVHYLAYRLGPKSDLGLYLEQTVPGGYPWDTTWAGWVSVEAIPNAAAAITAVQEGNSLRSVLDRCIKFGGDVDTISAIAMFSASLTQMPSDLPSSLYIGLERGEYGASYLLDIDKRLTAFAIANGVKR